MQCTERRESHKRKRSRRATDGRRVARRGGCRCARTPRPAPSRQPPHPAHGTPSPRLPAALSHRAASFLLVQLRSFSPLPHFRPPRRLCRALAGQYIVTIFTYIIINIIMIKLGRLTVLYNNISIVLSGKI